MPDVIRFEHLHQGGGDLDKENVNAVTAIIQDQMGYVWFGGENGLARFNGIEFEVFHTEPRNESSISSNYVWDFALDLDGKIWVATGQGLNRFNPANHNFTRYSSVDFGDSDEPVEGLTVDVIFSLAVGLDNSLYLGTNSGLFRMNPQRTGFESLAAISSGLIRELYTDSNGQIWVGTTDRGLLLYDPKSDTVEQWLNDPDDPHSIPHNYVRAIERDAEGALWIGTLGKGVARMDKNGRSFTRFSHDPEDPHSIGSSSIWDIHKDKEGLIWVATDPGGLSLFNSKKQNFVNYRHNPYQLSSLSSNKVRAIFDDHQGDLWVGTFPSGIHYFNKSTAAFTNYFPQPEKTTSLSHANVTRFFEDSENRIWVGTEGGLNEFHPKTKGFTHYLADERNPAALQSNAILAISEDSAGDLWIGTWAGGLHHFNKNTGKFIHYGTREEDSRQLADDFIWSLLHDSQGRFWVGTENAGLQMLPKGGDRFLQFGQDRDDSESISFPHVWSLLEDSSQRIWVGTINGLDLVKTVSDGRAQFQRFRHDPQDPNSLSGNRIISLLEDKSGKIWVGTQDSGVNCLDPETGEISRLSVLQGLPSNHISSMVEDDFGNIWMTTVNGLAMVEPQTMEIRTLTQSSGLVTNNYNRDATFKDSRGLLYFGGTAGFSIAHPDRLFAASAPPKVVLSDFRLFNRSIYANSADSPLTDHINQVDEIELSHKDAMFTFEFFAVNYRASRKNQYAYKLEGFDRQWIFNNNLNSATYTNLDPGRYVFRVRAANSDGVWNKEGPTVSIVVRGPFFLSTIAIIFYVCLIILAGMFVIRLQRKQLQYQNQKVLSDKLVKVDRLKDAFLANTSHELRTPLNGIIGLAENILDGAMGEVQGDIKHSLRMIASSGRRLSSLINDILDFSKLNADKLQLVLAPLQLKPIIDNAVVLLEPLIDNKPLRFINDVPSDLAVMADENRLQQILMNLMGNAVKFSEAGHVRIYCERLGGRVAIAVEDTGAGIAEQDLKRVFTVFTQLNDDETREQGGTGLGLAITKQLVELHGGQVSVDSTLREGSTFRFTLAECDPEQAKSLKVQSKKQDASQGEKLSPILASENEDIITLLKPSESPEYYTILIVDDDAINRMVLSSMLTLQKYKVYEAKNGEEALGILEKSNDIDLVILDVMMPKISGYETCMRLRVNNPVHVLPVLFLTAKNFSDDLVRGFVAGGNDFLTKPISKPELLSRVSTHLSLLEINRKLEEKYEEATFAKLNNDKELRTLEHIVEIINREMSSKVLLRELLDDVKGLTEADEIVYWQAEPLDDSHYLVLGAGNDGINEICLHNGSEITEMLERMYCDGQSIFVLDDEEVACLSEFQFVAETFPQCQSTVLMTIYFERSVVGFITMLSYDKNNLFGADAIATLRRIHAHVTSAIVKAKLLEQLGLQEIE